MPYITGIRLYNHHVYGDLEMEIPESHTEIGRHLILTGPNGCGKSTTLNMLVNAVQQSFGGVNHRRRQLIASQTDLKLQLNKLKSRSNTAVVQRRTQLENQLEQTEKQLKTQLTELDWSEQNIAEEYRRGKFISAFLGDVREKLSSTSGMAQLRRLGATPPGTSSASTFIQYLAYIHTQARLARYENNDESKRLFGWIDGIEKLLSDIVGRGKIKFIYDRSNYTILAEDSVGNTFPLQQLAAGHSSVLKIVSELLARIDVASFGLSRTSPELSGVVLIDELDVHLHPSLQRRILPALIDVFPRLQFIVATHSPIIISSAPNVAILDLGTKEIKTEKELRGMPYGRIMIDHFGITSDIDLDTERYLIELREAVSRYQERGGTEIEKRELRMLLSKASKSSHAVALEAWNLLLKLDIEDADDQH